MPFDPDKPFTIVEPSARAEAEKREGHFTGTVRQGRRVAEEQGGFDPSRPFTIVENKGFLEKAKDFVTGEGRRDEDLPALSMVTGLENTKSAAIAAGMFATPDEEAVGDIVVKVVPGAKKEIDKHGNVIIEFPNEMETATGAKSKRFFVNPPGMDFTDATQVVGEITKFFPAGKIAAGASTVLGGVLRAVAGEAATSIAGDVIAGQLGSEQGVDLKRAAIAGATAGGAEFLTPAFLRFFRRTINTPKFYDKSTGLLTKRGRQAAEKAGIDPSIMDSALGKDFAENLAQGADPEIAAGQALSNKFGVGMTRGQLSQNVDEIAREEVLRNTEPSSQFFRPRDAAQREAAEKAAGDVQERVGGLRIGTEDVGGGVVTEGIESQRNALLGAIDDAFDIARGKTASFTRDGITPLSQAAAQVARDFPIDDKLTPGSFKILREIARLSRRVKGGAKRGQAVNFQQFEQARKRINHTIDTIGRSNRADKALAVAIKKKYDEFLDDAFDNALFSGDADVLEAFKTARGLRRSLTTRFGQRHANDEAGRIVEKIIDTNATTQQTVNYIFGASRLGGKDVSEKVIKRLKSSLGEQSDAFKAMKEIGFMRLTRPAGKSFTPSIAAKNIAEVKQRSPGIMRELFTEDERNVIDQFGDLMKRLVTPREATNPSRTAFVLRNATRQALGRAQTMATFRGAPEGGFLIQLFKDIVVPKGGGQMGQARRAFRPFKTPGSAPVIAGGAAVGSGAAESMER